MILWILAVETFQPYFQEIQIIIGCECGGLGSITQDITSLYFWCLLLLQEYSITNAMSNNCAFRFAVKWKEKCKVQKRVDLHDASSCSDYVFIMGIKYFQITYGEKENMFFVKKLTLSFLLSWFTMMICYSFYSCFGLVILFPPKSSLVRSINQMIN